MSPSVDDSNELSLKICDNKNGMTVDVNIWTKFG